MKIVVAGGTGFVGSHLCRTMIKRGHEVTVLTRDPSKATKTLPGTVSVAGWNGFSTDTLSQHLNVTDALVNLCGEPLADARWIESRKQLLLRSRIDTTHRLVETLSETSHRPGTLINASGIGFYGPQEHQWVGEDAPPGNGFLADLCVAWEREAKRAEELGVRVILLRTGMVLGKTGGALPKMILPFRLFVGGPISPGTQKVSWIHQEDLSEMILWLIEKPNISGPVNAVSPETVSMKEFCKTLGRALNRPSWVPVPEFVLNLALGEMATVMTKGQEVRPLVLKENGFTFAYPNLDLALQSLFKESHDK